MLPLCQQGAPAPQATPAWEEDMPRLAAAIRAAVQYLANIDTLVTAGTKALVRDPKVALHWFTYVVDVLVHWS